MGGSSLLYCTMCGAANTPNDAVCFACGEALDEDTTSWPVYPAPGSLLKQRYRILHQVGTGGFGAVYKAEDTFHEDQLVAIKEINLNGLKPLEIIEATDTFNREVTLLSGLKHDHLPRVYEHFTDPDHWYLIMNFIGGDTLEDYVKDMGGKLALEDVLDIGIQLCTVLDYLHHRQPPIIFRDVKPANIMRTPGGHLYLIDFGIARHFTPGQTRDTIALGSPGYAAPEQYGKAQTTPQSDIYGLGVTLHQLLTGNDPAASPFRFAPLRSVDSSLPSRLEALISQMLELDVSKRPLTVAEVKQQLQQIAAGQSHTTLSPYYRQSPGYHIPTQAQQAQMAQQIMSARAIKRASKRARTKNASYPPYKNLAIAFAVITCVIAGLGSLVFIFPRYQPEECGCAAELPPHAPNSQQAVSISVVGTDTITSLDPALAGNTASMRAVSMIFTGLVSLDDGNLVRSQMAAYDQSADGLTWTFHLRSNLKFSDGTPLTSQDVVYSIDRALQPATHSATAMIYLGVIKDANLLQTGHFRTLLNDSLLAPDSDTVIMKLSKPAAYFLTALAYPVSYVVEKKMVEKYGEKAFTTDISNGGNTGPFKVLRYSKGEKIDFVRNDYYYGPEPQLGEVSMLFYNDPETSYQAYQSGQIDMTNVPFSELDQAQANSEFHQIPQLTTYYYTMNYLTKPFDNIHIRQAFELALNKDVLAKAIWLNTRAATNHIIPLGMAGYNSVLTGPSGEAVTSGDQANARQLLQQGLQEEGYASVSQMPSITFTYQGYSALFNSEIESSIAMWQQVLGVPVKAKAMSAATLYQQIDATRNNHDGLQMWASSWSADYADPEDFTTLQFDKGSPFNTINYGQNQSSDAALQQAVQSQMEAADVNGDATGRIQIYQHIEQQLVNDVAWIPMFQSEESLLLKSFVTGMNLHPESFIPPDDWAFIYIAAH